jgi:flagellar biosynthesis protein FliQ
MNEDRFTICDALYCAIRYLGFNLLYSIIVLIPIVGYLFVRGIPDISLNSDIPIAEPLTAFFHGWRPKLYLGIICIAMILAYVIHVLSINKTLMHEYKHFKFAIPFAKIKHKDAILIMLSMLVVSFLISIVSGSLLFATYLHEFALTFISSLISIYLYINFWKKTKVIRPEKTNDSQS